MSNESIMFVSPTYIGNDIWDFHYHVGLTTFERKKTGENLVVVYFHKTIQNHVTGGKEPKRCYFENELYMQDVKQVICIEKTNGIMSTEFKNPHELVIIEEILRRPFIRTMSGGGNVLVKVLGRRRRVVFKNNKEYVKYEDQYLTLKRAYAIEKKKQHT
jgi:hypothetical protein